VVRRFEDQDPWELLEVTPDASRVEIEQAYQRFSRLLAPGSLALYSAADPEEQRRLAERLREAYLTLVNGSRPVGPEPVVSEVAAAQLGPDERVGGAVLRRVREARGLSVAELAESTRIRAQILEALETETFEHLPERVFVRGFVMAVARELGIDPWRAWDGFARAWPEASNTPSRERGPA
jgi:hypothetical protein